MVTDASSNSSNITLFDICFLLFLTAKMKKFNIAILQTLLRVETFKKKKKIEISPNHCLNIYHPDFMAIVMTFHSKLQRRF